MGFQIFLRAFFVTANVTDLIKDKGLVKYRSRIARTANNDTEVDGIAVEMETKSGTKEKVNISRGAILRVQPHYRQNLMVVAF